MATSPVEPVEVQTSSSEGLRHAQQQRRAVVLSVGFLVVVVVVMLACVPIGRPLTHAASAVAHRSMYLSSANGVGLHDHAQTLPTERKEVTSVQDHSAQFQAFVPVLSNQAPDPLVPATHPGRPMPPRVGPSMKAAVTGGQNIAQGRGASPASDPERKVDFMRNVKTEVYSTSTLLRRRPFQTTTIEWGALVGTRIPDGWVEDVDYDLYDRWSTFSALEPGALVAFEQRVDGRVTKNRRTVKFGQVVRSVPSWDTWPAPRGGLYEVVISMNVDGTPGATVNVEGVDLLRPVASSLNPVLESMPDIEVVKPGWGISNALRGIFTQSTLRDF